jgi:hypothetical protein
MTKQMTLDSELMAAFADAGIDLENRVRFTNVLLMMPTREKCRVALRLSKLVLAELETEEQARK